jgi:peptide/nickel transport system permease protein
LAARTDVADVAAAAPAQVVIAEHTSLTRAAIRRFLRHRLAVIGSLVLLTIVLMAVFADFISSKPFFTDVKAISQPPALPTCSGRTGQGVTSGPAWCTAREPRSSSVSAPLPST